MQHRTEGPRAAADGGDAYAAIGTKELAGAKRSKARRKDKPLRTAPEAKSQEELDLEAWAGYSDDKPK